jgi:phospho-N-acetylmuramoyl-pentapeptide-transferase
MLLAGALSTLLVIVLGPFFIRWAQRNEFGQNIREDGPQGHITAKAGTPTMGGVLVLACMTPVYLRLGWAHAFSHFGITVWATTMLCALIGFWDDWMKIANRRSLGLSGRKKMVALALVTGFLGYAAHYWLHLPTTLHIPLTHHTFDLGWGYYVFLFLVLAGASNAVNLTDGLDGLAASTVTISLLVFMAINFIVEGRKFFLRRPGDPFSYFPDHASLDVAVFCAALAGALIGFLWWNSFPARVFMGDTGSMALGGALAALAVVDKQEILLVVIGGIFVVEALSVMIQVMVFKRTRKRVFLMAPIHHHFELRNWSETQIMVRFGIVAAMLSATGFTIWWRTY